MSGKHEYVAGTCYTVNTVQLLLHYHTAAVFFSADLLVAAGVSMRRLLLEMECVTPDTRTLY